MKKTEFILIGFLIALIVSVGLAQFAKAEEKKYFVFLPFVAKNADLRPRIEIDYVPPLGISYNYPDRTIRGRVLNAPISEAKLMGYEYLDRSPDYAYWDSYTNVACNGKKESYPELRLDGSFEDWLSSEGELSTRFFRFYLLAVDYCPPTAYLPSPPFTIPAIRGVELPPDPPTPEVWAMVEIERLSEGWRIIQKKP